MNKWLILENNLICPYCGDEYAFESLITKTTWENGEIEYIGGYFCPNCGKKLREQNRLYSLEETTLTIDGDYNV